jgi:hypothetical protein
VGLSVTAQNDYLDNTLGTARGAATPAVLEIALFAGDPEDGGVELSADGGYERTDWSSDDWTAAENGRQYSDGDVEWTSTDEWSDVATHWAAFVPAEEDPYMSFALDDELDVSGAGSVAITLRVQHADAAAVEA